MGGSKERAIKMESAIPNHLKCPRALTRRIPDDYQPPFPAQVARADASLKKVVMGYFGVQSIGDDQRSRALSGLKSIVKQFDAADGPQYYDLAQYRDGDGYDNMIAIAYWKTPDEFQKWQASKPVADWWTSDDRLKDGVGYFREVITPRAEQFETLYAFKGDYPGVGAIMGGASDDVQEHGYWGGMRDRIPFSQTDRMSPVGELTKMANQPVS
jgi:aldoxime dehydratase